MADESTPVACTLTTKDASQRVLEWQNLHRVVRRAERVDGGVRLDTDPELLDRLADLARREETCCAFLTISTWADDEAAHMEITSANPDAAPVIERLAGLHG